MTGKAQGMHIVHTEAAPGFGGQQIRVLTEAAGMIRRGHRVTLLCPENGYLFNAARERGLPAVAMAVGSKSLASVRAVRGWLKTNAVDVVNTHSSADTWVVALAFLALRHAPPLVRTRHISTAVGNNPASRWLYQRATAHIVTTGEPLRRQLIAHNRFDPERITSVPSGIDTGHFVPGDRDSARRRLGIAAAGLLVGTVASLIPWKGHRYLLQAFAQLADKSARLVIVGDGSPELRADMARQIASLGIGERVLMAGYREDVLPWLQAMDVFVLASYGNEGLPQALLQAMACGLPVVTTPVGSIPEAVDPERTGILVPPAQVEPLRQAMGRLLDSPDLRRSLGARAAEVAAQRFGMQPMLDTMETVFRSVRRKGVP